jgi:tetratricopeptide (TPR) repeat protein
MANGNAEANASKQPAAHFDACLRHFRAGDLATAEAQCREALAIDPTDADCLHLLGLIHARNNQIDPAIELIAQAIRNNRTKPDYFSNLGKLLALRQRFDEALKSYDIALKLRPDWVELWMTLGDLLQRQSRFQEALLTYDHALKLDPGHAAAAEKAARILQRLERFDEAAVLYHRWAAIEPNGYDAHNDLGRVLLTLRRHEEAAAAFARASELRPDAPAAFNNLGIALTDLKRFTEAVAALDRAIALAPQLAETHNNKANALKALNRFDEALAHYDHAIALKLDYVEAHANRGTCLDELARPDEALASYFSALALQPDHGAAHWNLSVNRLRAGDFETGWREAEWAWRSPSLRLEHRSFVQPLWFGAEEIAGKVVLLHNEQGLGDAIQFCRYIPWLAARGARVVLEIASPLHQLLSAMPAVAQCISRGEALPDFDFHCPISSLPRAFDTTLDTIPAATPYLSVPDGARDWNGWLGESRLPRIGLVWSGNPKHVNDHNRSIALQALPPLLELDAQFVSLQKGPRAEDQAWLAERNILDAAPGLESFADTASLVAQLDLVISVDTSVAHLAGALGKPVWVLLPHVADWRWLTGRTDSPWYPTARLFRQRADRAWSPVVIELREALERFIAGAAATPDRGPAGSSARSSSRVAV